MINYYKYENVLLLFILKKKEIKSAWRKILLFDIENNNNFNIISNFDIIEKLIIFFYINYKILIIEKNKYYFFINLIWWYKFKK